MKRFYTTASIAAVAGGWQVALDGKPVRTPARAALVLPTATLAGAVAAEWQAQDGKIEPATMPLTGLGNAAIDRVAPDAATFAASLARYAETELLAYRAGHPADLVARQAAVWDPLLDWARRRYDIGFAVTTSIVHIAQPAATLARIGTAFASYDAFQLAALNQIVTISGSAVIGMALTEGEIDTGEAWAAGQLDELWQAEKWARDPLVEASWADRRRALAAAGELLSLLDERTSAP